MTENKRFHFGYVLGDTGLIDEQAEDKWFIENCCNVSDLKKNWKNVCDKLNEVADENEQLKQTNQRLNDELQETMGYLALKSGVEKENEQLKQQINDCKKDEKQLGISFMEYKMQLIEVLQQNYNYAYNQRQRNLDNSIIARTYEVLYHTIDNIAKTMNVDIERFPKGDVE